MVCWIDNDNGSCRKLESLTMFNVPQPEKTVQTSA